MERRHYERVAVNLNVALVDERSMPRGCRVRDVSQGGMLLQFEHQAGSAGLEPGEPVTVRLSLREAAERRVLLLPATVQQIEENGIRIAFNEPQTELMQLMEPYRLDRAPASSTAAENRRATDDASTFISDHPSRFHQRIPNAGARVAERIAAARESIRAGLHARERTADVQPPPARADRKLFQLALTSLVVAVTVVLYDFVSRASIDRRIESLANTVHEQAEALAGVKIRVSAGSGWENRVADLNQRLDRLAVSVSALETGHFSPKPATGEPPPAPARVTPASKPESAAPPPRPTRVAAAAPASPEPPAPTTKKGGPWVINLVSLYDQAAADRFVKRARDKGIKVDQDKVQVKGKPVWRLQVGGFASRDEAQAFGDANKAKLGLKSVWIYSR
jgi:cell division septation protein DedD